MCDKGRSLAPNKGSRPGRFFSFRTTPSPVYLVRVVNASAPWAGAGSMA